VIGIGGSGGEERRREVEAWEAGEEKEEEV